MNELQGGFIVPPELQEYLIQHPNEIQRVFSEVWVIEPSPRKWWQFWKPKVKISIGDLSQHITDNGKS